jgi:cellulose synthase/poly-beta-1,6-N-acetylglucosamine synthase-like glycosyltransferase
MEWIFWLCILYIGFVEIGYLGLLWILTRFRSHPSCNDNATPFVTVLIAAYNEEKIIRTKIQNTLELEYPTDKIQILVASDCSSDQTDEIVREFADQPVSLIRSCPRNGKIAALRVAEEYITGDLVLFTDADSMLSSNTLHSLVRWFADPQVGQCQERNDAHPRVKPVRAKAKDFTIVWIQRSKH